MEDLVAHDTQFGHFPKRIVKILKRWFVAADILGRNDGVERLAEQHMGAGKRLIVDICDCHQFEMPAQISHRFAAIRERRPGADGSAEFTHFIFGRGGVEVIGHPPEHPGDNIAVGHAGVLRLHNRFMTAIGGQQTALIRLNAGAFEPRRQGGQHAALPIDERSVAIESKRGIIAEPHAISQIPYFAHAGI